MSQYVISHRLESLSNELLLDIFEYLDAYQLCQAFYGLNHRLNALLRSAHLHVLFDSLKQDKTLWNTLISCINSSKTHRLSYEGDGNDEKLLHFDKENLCFLSLHNMNHTSMNKILEHIPTNNQIKCFYIKEKCHYYSSGDRCILDCVLIDHGHRFTSLVNLSLSTDRYKPSFSNVSVIFSQLRRLSINNCVWSPNTIRFLQDNTPNLRSLHICGSWCHSNQSWEFVLKHIHELHINYSNNFIGLKTILSMFSSLRRLHIDWTNASRSEVVNGTQWQEIIEKCMPHLKQLTIDLDEGIDEEILQTFYIGEFWSKKKVNVKMIIDKMQCRYRLVKTIYFGQPWRFDYFRDL